MENQNSEKEGVTCIEFHDSFHIFYFPVFVIHRVGELSALHCLQCPFHQGWLELGVLLSFHIRP